MSQFVVIEGSGSSVRVIGVSASFLLDGEDVIEVGDVIAFPPVEPTRNIGILVSRVTKQIDPKTRQRALLIEIEYTHVDSNDEMPLFRIVPSILQEVEPYDSDVQYLSFSARPYQTIAFRVPNIEIVDRFETFNWITKKYKNQVYFRGPNAGALIPPKWGVPEGPTPFHVKGQLPPPP